MRHRSKNAGTELGLLLGGAQVVVQPGKFIQSHILMVEYLDHLLAGNNLLRKAVQHAKPPLLPGIGLSPLLHDHLAQISEKGRGNDGDGSEYRACVEHQHNGSQDGDGAGNDLNQRGVQHFSDGIDVVGKAGHDIPSRMGVEIADREALQPVKKLRTHAHQRALGGLQHQPLL